MLTVRKENPKDRQQVFSLNEIAFGRTIEAEIVEQLRKDGLVLSLVAEINDTIVGHIMFSRILIGGTNNFSGIALGPMAVHPDHQGKGTGSTLVTKGLEILQEEGEDVVVVLGHADYYPRFGFTPARPLGIIPPFELKDDSVWMAKLLSEKARPRGLVHYPSAFNI